VADPKIPKEPKEPKAPKMAHERRKRSYWLAKIVNDKSIELVKQVEDVVAAKKLIRTGELGEDTYQVVALVSGKLRKQIKQTSIVREE
jgi:hypothetical protein